MVPAVLFLAISLILSLAPATEHWVDHAAFRFLPYGVLTVSILLGACFNQSRISFLCILIAFSTWMLDHQYFDLNAGDRGHTIVFLCAIYLPLLSALFYRLTERGIFTIHGMTSGVVLLSTILVLHLLPGIESLSHAVATASGPLFAPLSDRVRIPAVGLLTLVAAAPFLIIKKEHESPSLGPIILMSLMFVFAGMNFCSAIWPDPGARTVLLTFSAGAAFSFAWAVMESSWRSANIDPLTELPGRRSLMHHFNRLRPGYTLAMLDADRFKRVNDRYGHDTGDQVLKFIAGHLSRFSMGKAYRYGGEEFVLVCERGSPQEITAALEDLRQSIGERKFVARSTDRPRKKPENEGEPKKRVVTQSITVTVSIGLARWKESRGTPLEVLEAADKAVYRAKKGGRNCLKAAR